MRSPTPHVRLIHTDEIPPAAVEDFVHGVSSPGLDLVVEKQLDSGPFAGLEWLVPTGLILFIGQGYFNGFLSEMGKEHYAVLKDNLKALRDRSASVKVKLIRVQGRPLADQPYSLLYSIYFEDPAGRRFKFLVPNGKAGDPESERAMDAFGDFLAAAYSGDLDANQKAILTEAPAVGATVLLAFNPRTGRIDPIHPITRVFIMPTSEEQEGQIMGSLDPPLR
jgi:hypothetical protein